MKVTRALLSALLLGGTCTCVLAQTKIVETAPGTKSPGGTNALGPTKPPRVPGGNLLDQIYRPSSIKLAPLEIGPSKGFSSPGANIDPVLRRRFLDDQSRKKNWAIENAASINRNGGEVVVERRRSGSENDGRKSPVTGREPTPAEVRLQAVDPKYAREFQENSGAAKESGFGFTGRQALQGVGGTGSRNPGNPDGPRDPASPDNLSDPTQDFAGDDKGKNDPQDSDQWDKSKLDNGLVSSRVEGAVDRAAAELGVDMLARGKGSGTEALAPRLESLRAERENELADILGTSAANTDGDLLAEGFAAPVRASRLADFQRLLAAEPPAVVSPKLGSEPTLSLSSGPLGSPAASLGLTRELSPFSVPSAPLNLGSAPGAATLSAPPRLLPQPAKLPFPVRGQGGF